MVRASSNGLEGLFAGRRDLIQELVREVVLERSLRALGVAEVHLCRRQLIDVEGDVVTANRCEGTGIAVTQRNAHFALDATSFPSALFWSHVTYDFIQAVIALSLAFVQSELPAAFRMETAFVTFTNPRMSRTPANVPI